MSRPDSETPRTTFLSGVYSGVSTKNAIVDEYYYVPEVEVVNPDAARINMLMQGGSFCWDFKYYFQSEKIVARFKQFYYNTWQGNDKDDPFKSGNDRWEDLAAQDRLRCA